jgi:hypothetical protein
MTMTRSEFPQPASLGAVEDGLPASEANAGGGHVTVHHDATSQSGGASLIRAAAERTLSREIEAAQILIAHLKEIGEDDDKQLVADTLEGELNLQEAVESVIKSIVEEDEVLIEGINKARARLEVRKSDAETRIERKRAILLTAMQLLDLKKIVTPHATVSVRPVPPKLVVVNEESVPVEFFKRADPVLDKKTLTDRLKALAAERETLLKMPSGEERTKALAALEARAIPGVELSNGGQTIQIRT